MEDKRPGRGNDSDNNEDCLGMTHLHILACLGTHDLGLYHAVVAYQPKLIVTMGKWSCLPIFYAIWGSVPHYAVQFLIDTQKFLFPNLILEWDSMLEELCRVGASLDFVARLLQIQQTSYPNQNVNLQKVARD